MSVCTSSRSARGRRRWCCTAASGLDLQPYRSLDPLDTYLRLIYLDHRGNGRSDRPDAVDDDDVAVGR